MDTAITPIQQSANVFHQIIDQTDKAESTKIKYKKAIDNALKANVNLTDRDSIREHAATLSPSGRAHLKAVITMLTDEYKEELEARVTLDTLSEVQVKLMRLNAIASAIQVQQTKGELAHIWLSKQEVKDLMMLCEGGALRSKRDKVILAVLVGAGLRREEMANLRFENIVLQPVGGKLRTVLNIKGKGAKNRVVPISNELAALLDSWAGLAGGSGAVGRAITKGGKKLRPNISAVGIFNIVREYGNLINRPELAPHDLRRTYAQIGYESGIPIDQISRLLGHADIATTQRYLNLQLNLKTTISDFVPIR